MTSSDPVHVIVYQNDGQQQQQQQQQQPISYKIPQLGVVSQEQVISPHNLGLGHLESSKGGKDVKMYFKIISISPAEVAQRNISSVHLRGKQRGKQQWSDCKTTAVPIRLEPW